MNLAWKVLVLPLVLAGCAQNALPTASPVKDEEEVRLVGHALSMKLGAAVEGEDFFVWIDGLDAWPEDLAGRTVEVEGVLETRHALPVFLHDPRTGDVPAGIPVPPGADLKAPAGGRFLPERAGA